MRAPSVTRALVRGARQAKVLVEECIVQAVRLHGKMLDRVVHREEEILEDFEQRTVIMQRAYEFAITEETQQLLHTSAVRIAVNAEKKELGLL
jgi:hypothetical protein